MLCCLAKYKRCIVIMTQLKMHDFVFCQNNLMNSSEFIILKKLFTAPANTDLLKSVFKCLTLNFNVGVKVIQFVKSYKEK